MTLGTGNIQATATQAFLTFYICYRSLFDCSCSLAAGLQDDLDRLGLKLVGYGCTTCIGNSGPLPEQIDEAVGRAELTVAVVLSGNRNFEGRIHPKVKANWLASPPLVVAYTLAGIINVDLSRDPIGRDSQGKEVCLKDIWPGGGEIDAAVRLVERDMFNPNYGEVFRSYEDWNSLPAGEGKTYYWDAASTCIQKPPFCELSLPEGIRKTIHRGSWSPARSTAPVPAGTGLPRDRACWGFVP